MEYLHEDDVLGITRVTENEKDIYYQMSKSRSLLKGMYDEVFENIWSEITKGIIIIFAVFEKKSHCICAFCQFNMEYSLWPEFGLDVLEGYMDKGYGTRAAMLAYQYASSWHNIEYFIWKADCNNMKSRKIAKYLGGELISEKYFLSDFGIEYGMEKGIFQEEDISIVCKYKIPRKG